MCLAHRTVALRGINPEHGLSCLQLSAAADCCRITNRISHRHIGNLLCRRDKDMFHAGHFFNHGSDIVGGSITVIHHIEYQLTVFLGINRMITIVIDKAKIRDTQTRIGRCVAVIPSCRRSAIRRVRRAAFYIISFFRAIVAAEGVVTALPTAAPATVPTKAPNCEALYPPALSPIMAPSTPPMAAPACTAAGFPCIP